MVSVRDVIILFAVAASLPFCFLRPVYGVMAWTILGFFNPQAFTWGIARSLPLAMAVAIPTLAGFLLFSRLRTLLCPEVGLIIALWVWFTVTTVNSTYELAFAEKSADAWFRWGFVSKIFLMVVVTIGVMDGRERLRLLALSIGGSFALLVFKTLPSMIVSGGEFRVYGPDHSMIGDNNAFGLAVGMALPFFYFLAKTESSRVLKLFFRMAFLLGIPTLFFTYSRGALVGLVAMAGYMFLRSNQRLVVILIAILSVLFASAFAPPKWKGRMSHVVDAQDPSARSRLNSWTYSWNLANAYPVMGGGFEAFTPALYAQYAPNPRDVHGPHSIYFGMLAEHGYVGFALYFSVVLYCFLSLGRIVKQARFHGDEEAADYANMLRFSLVSFLAAGAFLGHTYFDFYFVILSCAAILRRVSREDLEAIDDSDEEPLEAEAGDVSVSCAGM
jgi:putative inorganic carbon (HCO3(-)) transporter